MPTSLQIRPGTMFSFFVAPMRRFLLKNKNCHTRETHTHTHTCMQRNGGRIILNCLKITVYEVLGKPQDPITRGHDRSFFLDKERGNGRIPQVSVQKSSRRQPRKGTGCQSSAKRVTKMSGPPTMIPSPRKTGKFLGLPHTQSLPCLSCHPLRFFLKFPTSPTRGNQLCRNTRRLCGMIRACPSHKFQQVH